MDHYQEILDNAGMKIEEMELLVQVAENGSMTVAARHLHLTPAAVSAAVQRIEDAIGIRLFERTTRSLRPTDEGLVIIEGCADVVNRWQRVLDDARGRRTELEGTIRVAAPADTTYGILASIVVSLCSEHPNLRVVLHISDSIHHLHRDALDMAIRYGPLQDSTLSARKLADDVRILVASPSYLAQHGAPDTPKDLARHRCVTLQLSNMPMTSWQLYRLEEVQSVTVESPLCGDGYLTRRWAIAGMGIALKSVIDVIDDLEAGRLVRVLPAYTMGEDVVHAVFPSRRFLPARVRALSDAVTSHFAARAVRCQAWLSRD